MATVARSETVRSEKAGERYFFRAVLGMATLLALLLMFSPVTKYGSPEYDAGAPTRHAAGVAFMVGLAGLAISARD